MELELELDGVTFQGPDTIDEALLGRLPEALSRLLTQLNGFIAYGGGLHVRGACAEPAWHSLERVWTGPDALHARFDEVRPTDVPFGQDCMGDQFLLRQGVVHVLHAETGDLESLEVDLEHFLREAGADPVEYLNLAPLLQFEEEGNQLLPGEVLMAYPPFCTVESAHGVSLKAMPVLSQLAYLAEFARQVRGLSDGSDLEVKPSS